MEWQMSYNKKFDLDIDDIEIIENALFHKLNRLSEQRLTSIQSTIIPETELESVKEIDKEMKKIHNLLGKLHNQKIWYRPDNYVGG